MGYFIRRAARLRCLKFFQGYDIPAPSVRVRHSKDIACRHDGVIERTAAGYDIVLSYLTDGKMQGALMNGRRSAPFLYYLEKASQSVKAVRAHFSDGHELSLGGFFFSSCAEAAGLVPDPYFFETRGFAELRSQIEQDDVPWVERSEELIWRGGVNGMGYVTAEPALADNPAVNQRVRCAWLCQNSEIDFGFAPDPARPFDAVFAPTGLLKDKVTNLTWFGRKYALDLDGYSNTWDNQFHRFLMGCCVLKVAGDFGYRQWYYDRLNPWEHYVPVRTDLGDLFEKYDWVRSHDQEAREIAENGRALALSMTFEREVQVAARTLEENWSGYL